MFTMQACDMYNIQNSVQTFATLELALAAGFKLGVPFGVSVPSGAMVWVWEMRDERLPVQLAMAA